MRSFVPPKGALSRFTNPLRSLMFRLRPMEGQTVCGSMGSRAAHQTAFIMRRLIVKYWLSILITGNWSCTVPDLGCRHTKKKFHLFLLVFPSVRAFGSPGPTKSPPRSVRGV